MRLHARTAQLAMEKQGLPRDGRLGRSVAELRELSHGALAEMRALIFELRPEALAEEGMVAALGKQAAALSARSELPIAVDGPRDRLDVEPKVEEHLYRIVLEALNNAIKHAHATHATVDVAATGASPSPSATTGPALMSPSRARATSAWPRCASAPRHSGPSWR